MNIVLLSGNLVRDPVLREVESKGTKVVNFTIASNIRYRKANGEYETETSFVQCEAWDTAAEVIAELQKGAGLFVKGRWKNDNWEVNGEKRYRDSVRVEDFEVLVRKGKRNDKEKDKELVSSTATENDKSESSDENGGGDIPF